MAWIMPPTADERQNFTRGLTACAGEAHETKTVLDASSPQVRWICSGVPSAGVFASALKSAKGDEAAAKPVTPAPLKNPRRESESEGDSAASVCSAVWSGRRSWVTAISPVWYSRSIWPELIGRGIGERIKKVRGPDVLAHSQCGANERLICYLHYWHSHGAVRNIHPHG